MHANQSNHEYALRYRKTIHRSFNSHLNNTIKSSHLSPTYS